MRIRTDGEYSHREDTIEAAAEFWGCNKTRAVLMSCEVASDVVPAVLEALEHEDVPPAVAEELADALSSRRVRFDVETTSATLDVDSR